MRSKLGLYIKPITFDKEETNQIIIGLLMLENHYLIMIAKDPLKLVYRNGLVKTQRTIAKLPSKYTKEVNRKRKLTRQYRDKLQESKKTD